MKFILQLGVVAHR